MSLHVSYSKYRQSNCPQTMFIPLFIATYLPSSFNHLKASSALTRARRNAVPERTNARLLAWLSILRFLVSCSLSFGTYSTVLHSP
ncbi:hypothetical protein ACQKWADRAFT_288153 [Trichoderma austrokoningii]